MAFNDLLLADGKTFTQELGESIVYKRASDPGNPITLNAVVDRDALSKQGEDRGRSVSAPLEISVAVSDLPAVNASGGTPGGSGGVDTVQLVKVIGQAVAWFPVTAVIEQDAGLWHLAVGR